VFRQPNSNHRLASGHVPRTSHRLGRRKQQKQAGQHLHAVLADGS
jgi:hypothetical protein